LRKSDEGLTQKEFQKMMRHINENITSEHDNKLFEANFHEIHEVFFKKLLAKYPNLTSQDLKLAAYLKMNLTTKEIAPLFNITVRGLENKRYRLRNKLGLSPETNLSEFFIGFE
jgi:DNA-binding CsgD family transcriptional regulator